MTTTTPTERPERRERLLREWFDVSDRQEFARYREFLSDDVEFIFGNAEPVSGLSDVLTVGERMRGSLASVAHEQRALFHAADGRHVFAEMWVTYTRLDGRSLRLPAAVLFGFDDQDLIREYRIYVDQADLYS